MAIALTRKAWYELKYFDNFGKIEIEHFTLMIERKDVSGQEQFHRVFESSSKSLRVIGTLEK